MNGPRKTKGASGAAPGRPAQIPLGLPLRPPQFDRASFIDSDSNRTALQTVDSWRETNEPALVICGPASAGKTHLAHIVAEGMDADFISAGDVRRSAPNASLTVIDDLPGALAPLDLLKAVADAGDAGRRIVLVGVGDPAAWARDLKDLRTRLEAMPRAILAEPDEELLQALLGKLFRDRQVDVNPSVIKYAAPRLQRTFEAVGAFVALADEMAMETNGRISLAIAQKIVGHLSEAGFEG